MKRFLLFLCLFGELFALIAPAHALDLYNPRKKYKDEGKEVADPTSRCTGTSFKQTYAAAEAQAEKDFDAALKHADADKVQSAYDAYRTELGTSWSAMLQPYCGFGAFGTTAALKSLKKSIADVRKKFLTATGTMLAADPVRVATPVTTTVARSASVDAGGAVFGTRSAQVTALQQALVKSGFLPASLVTGYFGPMTRDALIAFQIKSKIIASPNAAGSGLVGPKTRAALAKSE